MTRLTDIKAMPTSEAVRKLNPDLFSGPSEMPSKESLVSRHAVTKEGKRLRQDTKGPNKLEREFHEYLKTEFNEECGQRVHEQSLTLVLANGVRYTPDFVVVHRITAGWWMLAFETKGFMRDDAAVKIKVAARAYPWIKFHLVTKKKKKDGGGWAIEEVLP